MPRSRYGLQRTRWTARLLSWSLVALAASAQTGDGKPPPEPPTPAELRAGTVLKLASYLTPEQPRHPTGQKPPPFRIGLLGKDDVTCAATKALPGKTVGQTTATVVQVDTLQAIEGRAADVCDLLFVADSIDPKVLARVVAMHADQPMPIVCERPGFARDGGAVQLFVEDKDLRFEVNVDALKAQGIKASPHLLKLSRKGPTR
jgi:hypothetical protein